MQGKEIMKTKRVIQGVGGIVLAILIVAGAVPVLSAVAVERIDAVSYGTSTQMGKQFDVQFTISHFSTPQDRKILADAFAQGQTSGLVKALSKMKPVGRVSVPGKTGYNIDYAAQVQTPTGRKIRIITNRWILLVENYHMTRTRDYPLTVADIDINELDKGKSSGVLAPASKFTLDKNGEIQFELYQNPWRLGNIIDWNNKSEK
jgi:hypothetical protein